MNISATVSLALAALALPAAVLAQAPAAHAGGEVMFVSGKAERLQKDAPATLVTKGMTLLEGDRIRTAADSHVYVRLRDGGLLVVRPASELHVDLWRYDPARPQDSQVKYTLDNGVARHVSGQAAKAAREKFRFNTPMAAIGVRGTDFTVLADASVTRVSVQSGGIVMNGFGEGCRAEGLGPCEGSSAVELFATAKDKLLQVRAGERRPELIDDPSSAPDRARPPTVGEPVAQRPTSAPDIELADSRGTELVQGPPAPVVPVPPAPEPPPVVQPPIVVIVEPPPPLPPEPAAIATWGRWKAIAAQDPGVVTAEEILAGRSLVAVNRFYMLAANSVTPSELPGAGVGNFVLKGHDGVITDKATGTGVASTASNGKLSIDFGARRFDTSMTVSAGQVSTDITAKGSIESNGRFRSDVFRYPSTIAGVVGGKDASQAVYLYNRSFGTHEASGAASWGK